MYDQYEQALTNNPECCKNITKLLMTQPGLLSFGQHFVNIARQIFIIDKPCAHLYTETCKLLYCMHNLLFQTLGQCLNMIHQCFMNK